MDLPPLEDNEPGWIAAILFLASVLWKVWFRAKRDSREDNAETREHAAEGDVIKVLRDEIARIYERVRTLEGDLEHERAKRYVAERQSASLQTRVDALEQRLRLLGQEP